MFFQNKFKGIMACLAIAVPAYYLGKLFPLIGGPVFAILLGMCFSRFVINRKDYQGGIAFSSKKILQYAVILLGFGLNLLTVLKIGFTSLPIIISTILTALLTAYLVGRLLNIDKNDIILIGVGSSICGGSAVAATAPVIYANDREIAKAISVIFFFNIVAALIFPTLGDYLKLSNMGFALFAGTAVNDTSSVTAAASSWDAIHHTGTFVLDNATIVKLTRTLAIIPITVLLAYYLGKKNKDGDKKGASFPRFILYFILASLFTTICHFLISHGFVNEIFIHYLENLFLFLKSCAKFFIIIAMAGIGFSTNLIELIRSGGKPMILGLVTWIMISVVSLVVQHFLGLW